MDFNSPSSTKTGGEMNGPNDEIVDQKSLEGAVPAASKRSRPTSVSSLDYQVKTKREQLTTTKPGKRKPQQQQQPDHQQQYRRSISTRARGSSGPPPRKFDLLDLEGMDEDQLLQALYEDPELATAAAKAAEQAKKKKRSTRKASSTTPPKDQYYRAADGSVKDVGQYPEHLREMIDGGVPVTQWIILLVLLCAGLYQLRKAVLGPAATTVSTSPVKTRSADKGKTKTSKQQKKIKYKDDKPPAPKVDESAQVTNRSLPPSQKKASTAPVPVDKQNAKNKKKTKAVSSDKKKKEDTVQQQPDKARTGESSAIDVAERDTAATKTTSAPIHTETANEDDEWQTVTKSRTAVSSEPKSQNAKSAEQDSQEVSDEGMPELVNGEQETEEDRTETNNAAASQTQESDAANIISNKQPKQQKKKQSSSGSGAAFADDDAALALKLQKEEETLAQGASAPDQEETWEEVSVKKNKSKGASE
jgi:hypothetical protein